MNLLRRNLVESSSTSIGVDLGGTSIRVGLFDSSMKVLGSQRFDTRVTEGPEAAVDRIAATVNELITTYAASPSIRGVGIGSPGPIDLRAGVLGELPNLPGWGYFPLRSALADATGFRVILESDANAAAIAEWKMGAGIKANVRSLAMITLGTGVGSGLILNGQVWHGIRGMGGELGHCSVDTDGPLCGCGTRGCLEVYASATGLVRLARGMSASSDSSEDLRAFFERPEGATSADIALLADAGDRAAIFAFERLGFYLGLGVANLVNTLDVPMILIGGGVAESWPLFAPAMFDTVREYSQIYRLVEPTQRETLEVDRTFIGPATLGSSAGLLGAGLLPTLA